MENIVEHVVKRADTVRRSVMNSSAFMLAISHRACLFIEPNPDPSISVSGCVCVCVCVCVPKKEGDRETGNWSIAIGV